MTTKRRHQLKSLTIIGGFLDGVRIDFAGGLNCLIGARGTGKTTILELIRYAMDALPKREHGAARKRIETLIEGNLKGGRVELEVETGEGLHYTVSRAVGDEPIVLDGARQPTGITVASLFRAAIFSQNDVESIADQSRYQLDLIDSFEPDEIAGINAHIAVVADQITALARNVETLTAKKNAADDEAKQLPAIEAKLATYTKENGGNVATAVNEAHRLKAQRDREIRAVRNVAIGVSEYSESIQSLEGHAKAVAGNHFTADLLTGPNAVTVKRLRDELLTAATAADRHLANARGAMIDYLTSLERLKGELQAAHAEQELAFRELVEKHKQHQSESAERANFERRRNELLARRREVEEANAQLAKFTDEHTRLLDSVSEQRDRRFRVRKQIAERLNRALMPNIKVTIAQDGNPEAYQAMVEETLRGMNLQRGVVAGKVVRLLPPSQLAALVRAGNTSALIERGELNAEQAEKVRVAFSRPTKLAELETVELLDEPTIQLRDGDGYKPSEELSTGQKCTTILPILLLESANPLLIDQPEDNLDNRFIFEAVVASIQQVKATRQLIFVTHNPNIPVLGEAERVVVMESDGEHARKTRDGTVDDCKQSIITLLEGGEEAFRKRSKRYQF